MRYPSSRLFEHLHKRPDAAGKQTSSPYRKRNRTMMITTQAPKTITERRSLESSDFGDLCESGMERVCAVRRLVSMARFGHGMARESDYGSNKRLGSLAQENDECKGAIGRPKAGSFRFEQ